MSAHSETCMNEDNYAQLQTLLVERKHVGMVKRPGVFGRVNFGAFEAVFLVKNLEFLNSVAHSPDQMRADVRAADNSIRILLHGFKRVVVGGTGDSIVRHV